MSEGATTYTPTLHNSKISEFKTNELQMKPIDNSTPPHTLTTTASHGHQHAVLLPFNHHYYQYWQPQQNLNAFGGNMFEYWIPNQAQMYRTECTVIERSVVYNTGNFLVHDFERFCFYNEYNEYFESFNPYMPYYQNYST